MSQPLFAEVPNGPPDPMFVLKQRSDGDSSPNKIDLGIGVYRSDKPGYHEFESIARAKSILASRPADHEYNPTTGINSFNEGAATLVLGNQHTAIQANMVASVQTVGGTGAVRLGAAFLNRNFPSHSSVARCPNTTKVYVGTPAWPNYVPLFQHAGFNVITFLHHDTASKTIDIDAALKAIASAPAHSIFVLQVCCHNPTGQDYTRAQWLQLADAIQQQAHFVFFDMAYQGFAHDMETDAWPIRYFVDRGIDTLVCQSFSKHMGLYSERIGVLHVPCKSAVIAANVRDQLRSLIRWEVSSTPAYGAKLADLILQDQHLRGIWLAEVQEACDRMAGVRKSLHTLLTQHPYVPGSWDHILAERGLFSYMKLDKRQVTLLRERFHVYVADSGRVNVAGLNEANVERFARALRDVVAVEDNIIQHQNLALTKAPPAMYLPNEERSRL